MKILLQPSRGDQEFLLRRLQAWLDHKTRLAMFRLNKFVCKQISDTTTHTRKTIQDETSFDLKEKKNKLPDNEINNKLTHLAERLYKHPCSQWTFSQTNGIKGTRTKHLSCNFFHCCDFIVKLKGISHRISALRSAVETIFHIILNIYVVYSQLCCVVRSGEG